MKKETFIKIVNGRSNVPLLDYAKKKVSFTNMRIKYLQENTLDDEQRFRSNQEKQVSAEIITKTKEEIKKRE